MALNKWLNSPYLNNFTVKVCQNQNKISVFVTNCQDIWRETLSETELVLRYEKIGISNEVQLLLDDLVTTIQQSKENEFVFNTGELMIRKQLLIGKRCRSINLQFKLEKLSTSEVYVHVVLPLITKCWQLKSSNEKLLDAVIAKDAEIAEYKASNSVNISRKNLITEPFNVEACKANIVVPDTVYLEPSKILEALNDDTTYWTKIQDLKIIEPITAAEESSVNIKSELISESEPVAQTSDIPRKIVKREKNPGAPVTVRKPTKRII